MEELNLNRCSQEHFDRAMELLKLARSCELYGDGFKLWKNEDFVFLYNAEKDIMLIQRGTKCEECIRIPSAYYDSLLKDFDEKKDWSDTEKKIIAKAKSKAEESRFLENLHKEAKKGV